MPGIAPLWLTPSDGTLCLSGYPIEIIEDRGIYAVQSPGKSKSFHALEDALDLALIWKLRMDIDEARLEHFLHSQFSETIK